MFTPSVHANGFVNIKMYYIQGQFYLSYPSIFYLRLGLKYWKQGILNWRSIAALQLAFQPLKCKINVENVRTWLINGKRN